MKILLVNHLLDSITGGGTAERTFQLAKYLAQDGHYCSILTLDIGIDAERRAELSRVEIYALPCVYKRFFIPQVSYSKICQLVANADVVHISSHWTILNAITYKACKQTKTPYLFCPAGAIQLYGRSKLLKRIYEYLVGDAILRDATYCVAITEDEAQLLYERGVAPHRVAVIPNGIDPQIYEKKNSSQLLESIKQILHLKGAPYILFLGRLSEIKGPDILLEAFSIVASRWPNHHLVFAGPDDGLQESIQARANTLGLTERVHFAGFLGGIAKVTVLHGADMLVIPSRHEAMSIVILEAGLCDCPVLFTNTCGLKDLALAGAGIEVEVGIHEISAGIEQVLEDLTAAASRAIKLKELVLSRFLWPIQTHRYSTLLDQISEN